MKKEYVITNEELNQKGLSLDDYALTGDFVQPLIYLAVDLAVDKICELGDNFKGESGIEQAMDSNSELVSVFKKIQYRILWNLLFTAETNPTDSLVDSIISKQFGAKINGFQKGLYYKVN